MNNSDSRLFIARRSITPPASLSDISISILVSFIAVALGAAVHIIIPSPPSSPQNYQISTYEYHPPTPSSNSVTIHTETSVAGHVTRDSITHTFEKPVEEIDCTVSKCIALTFDDGPSAYTDRLLDILQQSRAKATFFVLGHRVEAFSGQISRMAKEGHDVGSHSWIHRNLPRFPYALVLDDLSATANATQSITGQSVIFFRPPYGSVNSTVRDIASTLNHQIILWSIDPWDWRNKDANYVCDHIVDRAHPGGIIVLHDIYDTSVDATRCVIDRLSHDYAFVNLSTLYNY
jgi:peptidoglycan/xylan/chitin deacetylase (PgdA/CDA1 family)